MKRLVCGVVLLTFLFSALAFAVGGKASIKVSDSAQLAGKQVPKGEYKVAFSVTGNDAQVTLTSADKKTVVTATAKVVEGRKASRDAVVLDNNGEIKEIWIAGSTQSLVF